MVQTTRRRLIGALLLLWALPSAGQRLVLVSFDGLGAETFFEDPVADELTVLKAAARRGAASRGVQPAFPSTTANSHAALWTGCYGDVNMITANAPPLLPRAQHTAAERGNGFRAEQLAAETFWVAAARAGIPTVAHQPTQGYPFTRFNSAPGAVVVNGYQTKLLAPHALWTPAAGRRMPDGSYLFEHGPATFRVELKKASARITHTASGRWVEARFAPVETEPPRQRALARHFSPPLLLDAPEPAALHFRLFDLSEGSFRLYVTPWHELGASVPLEGIFREAGGFIGNGPTALLDRKVIRETEYLEAAELVVRQMTRHAAWLERKFRPRLLQATSHSRTKWTTCGCRRREPAMRTPAGGGAGATSRSTAARRSTRGWPAGTTICCAAPITAWLRCRSSSPCRRSCAGRASKTRPSTCITRSSSTRPTGSRASCPRLSAPRSSSGCAALAAVEGITQFFTPETDGARFGIGGPAGGDLYFDFAAGYGPASRSQQEVLAVGTARGMHGFLPARRDMQAIFVMTGPGIEPSTLLPEIRIIDIAPLIAELLGFPAPPTFRGRAPLAVRSGRPEAVAATAR